MDIPENIVAALAAIMLSVIVATNALSEFGQQLCPAGSYDMTSFVQSGVGISSGIIWEAKSFGLRECARFCISRSSCSSFTYHTKTTVCGLSRDTVDNGTRTTGPFLIYSEYQWLPSDIDPDCFDRPCGEYQVCVPGHLASRVTQTTGCSFSCIDVARPVCPLPKALNGSRHVGGVNVITCLPHEYGGGTATCRDDLTWDVDLQPCRPIYRSPCSNSTLCSPIGAVCSLNDSVCECQTHWRFDNRGNGSPTCKEVMFECRFIHPDSAVDGGLMNATTKDTVCPTFGYLVNGANPVSDDALNASSVYISTRNPNLDFGPHHARLYNQFDMATNNAGRWKPLDNDWNPFIEVRFSQPHIVRNVYTQGRPFTSDPANREQWVTKFQVQHSLDCVNFYKYNNWDGTALDFSGNTNQDTVVINGLPCPVYALCVRLYPTEDNGGGKSLRFDLQGCVAPATT